MARVLKTECHKAQMFEQSVKTNWNNDINNVSYGLMVKRESSVSHKSIFNIFFSLLALGARRFFFFCSSEIGSTVPV